MKHKLVLTAVLAALAGGVAVTSAQAAPVSGSLIGVHSADALVQKAHYSDHRYRKPWWWYHRRFGHDHWGKPKWKRHHHKRDWSWRDDYRRDYDRRRR